MIMQKTKPKFKQTEIGMIPDGWEVKELGEEIELIYGKGLTERQRENGEIPVFGSNGIIGFHNKPLVKGPGVIIGRKGSVGEVKFSKKDFWPIDTTYYLKLKSEGDIAFWYYFLLSLGLNKLNSHSAVPGLNRDQVYQIISKIPPLSEQRVIAKILSDLDSKIELNQQMNKTLEEIGKAIFKHWFIDFEFPNEEGKPYKSSGGEMVYNEELGKEIPKGWSVGIYSDLVEITTGKGLKREEFVENGAFPVLGANGELGRTNKFLFDEELILTGRVGTLGTVNIVKGKVWVSDNVLISKAKKKENFYYAYFVLKNFDLQSLNRGSTQPLITQTDLRNQICLIPDNEILSLFDKILSYLFYKISQNQIQALILSSLRDVLLPKLMSGKIRVPLDEKRCDS